MDRCHCGPEMLDAYRLLVGNYPGARLLSYHEKKEINGWRRPPFWRCRRADLIDESGKIIASRNKNKLAVYSFSPPVNKLMSLKYLQKQDRKHLLLVPSCAASNSFLLDLVLMQPFFY